MVRDSQFIVGAILLMVLTGANSRFTPTFGQTHGSAPVLAEPSANQEKLLEASNHFRSNYRITDVAKQSFWAHTFSSGAHSVAVRQQEVYTVWYDVRNQNSDVFFAKSTDGGLTFGPNVQVNDDRGKARQYKPSLGMDDSGTIYMIWRDDRKGHADIYFSRSKNGGKTFSRNRRLNDDREWAYQGNPSLGVSPEGLVYATWSDNREGKDDIYFTASQNGGRVFSRNRRLNDDEGDSVQSHPTVGVGSGGLVVVAWEDFRNGYSEIYMTRSTDGGKTFEPNRKVIAQPGGGQQVSPSLTVNSKGWIALAWAEYKTSSTTLAPPDAARGETLWWDNVRKGDADIYIAVSRGGGAHFGTPIRVNDDPAGNPQAFPSIAMDSSGDLFVAWEDFRSGQSDIYFAKFQERESLIPNQKVNNDQMGASQYHPSLAVDESGRSYLLWTDGRDNPLVAFKDHGRGNDVYFASGK